MQTILVLLNPGKLKNPDVDLCYCVPDRIEAVTHGTIRSNGYDFIDTEAGRPGPLMGIWLETGNAVESWPAVAALLRSETFKGNDLSQSAQICISEQDTAEPESCTQVFPAPQ